MVWAGIAALWAVVALWMLAERAVATGWAYRALSGYAEHRAARHGAPAAPWRAYPERDDDGLVTHAAVLQLLDPDVAAMFAPVPLTPMGDRGVTARWFIRGTDDALFPSVSCTWQGGHRHTWPDGVTTSDTDCPAWVFGTTRAAATAQLRERERTAAAAAIRRAQPAVPVVPAQVSHAELQGWANTGRSWITQERVRGL